MEIKKNPKSDLERTRGIILQIGFVVSLGLTLLAFEWATQTSKVSSLGTVDDVEIEEEIVPITRQDQIKPPPPPPAPKVTEVLTIVEDDVEIEEEYEVEDVETDLDEEIEIIEVEEEEEEEAVFFIVEEMPQFPGGDLALRKYIAEHVKYPAIARENDIQGKVYVRFCVTKVGSVDQVSVARGVDPLLDAEAMRVVQKLPTWKPGKQRGKAVNVWYTVPINFQLQ